MKKFSKYFFSGMIVVIALIVSLFNFTSCEEGEDDKLVCDLRYYSARQTENHLGISVEEDPVNGTYLSFKNDSVFDGFLDKMDHMIRDERESLVQSFYEEGFISRKQWEETNAIAEAEQHPSFTFSLLINPNGMIKIGDVLYLDDHEQRLYQVDEKGNKSLIKGNISKDLKRESKTVKKEKEGFYAGRSGLPTMSLTGILTYDVRIIRDDIVEVTAYSYTSEVDKEFWRRANSTFDITYSYDYKSKDKSHCKGNATIQSYDYSYNFSELLLGSWEKIAEITEVSVTISATLPNGSGLSLDLAL